MAAAVEVTIANKVVTVAATGFATTNEISLVLTGPHSSFILHDVAATDESGDYTWSSEIEFGEVGVLNYSVTDGSDTVEDKVQIWNG